MSVKFLCLMSFFFPAEDGIRVHCVTGVQTCALPIWPLLFGHADADTVAAVRSAAERGTSFGAPTEGEVDLAAAIADAVRSEERRVGKVRTFGRSVELRVVNVVFDAGLIDALIGVNVE